MSSPKITRIFGFFWAKAANGSKTEVIKKAAMTFVPKNAIFFLGNGLSGGNDIGSSFLVYFDDGFCVAAENTDQSRCRASLPRVIYWPNDFLKHFGGVCESL